MYSLLLLWIILIAKGYATDFYPPWFISAGPTYSSYAFNILQHLSAISPYFESNTIGLNPDPPQGCAVKKAVYLVRHGSIYANDNDYNSTILPFLDRLKNFSRVDDFSNSVDLAFLTEWISPITNSTEELEKLSKSGTLEAFTLGTEMAYRYPKLIPSKKNASFKIWVSASDRTKLTGSALFSGLYAGEETIGQIVPISESEYQGANTLTPKETCPRFNSSAGSKEANVWLAHYTIPILARLNAKNSGFHFVANDVLAMQELCGYETVIRGYSPFCKLFTSEEWLAFEYYFDIKYVYEYGYKNELSPSLGLPWIVASSKLLNNTNNLNQDLYIYIAHREMPPFLVTALGLYNDSIYSDTLDSNRTFPLDQINYQRLWKSSEFVPFLGHVALERLDCVSAAYNGSFVRVLVNSAPKPLPQCTNGPGGSCPLKQYMDYINDRNQRYKAFSLACGVNYQNSTDLFTYS